MKRPRAYLGTHLTCSSIPEKPSLIHRQKRLVNPFSGRYIRGVKQARKLLLSELRARLSLRQKFLLISTLKWLSIFHLRSFFSPTAREVYRTVESAFNVLRPYSTQYDEIRVGGSADGGYVIPRINQQWDVLISPGVGGSSNFEISVATSRTKVVLIDANVPKPPGLPDNFEFIDKLLGVEDDANTVSLDSIVSKYCSKHSWVMLQMDIEGAEWPILEDITNLQLQKFQIVILELHNLENLMNSDLRKGVTEVLNKLSTIYFCSHFHVNNAGGFFFLKGRRFPRVVEVTLLNRNFFTPGSEKLVNLGLDSASEPAIYDWHFKF